MTFSIEEFTEERPSWRHYVTPKLTKARPIYNWFVYPHSFDKALIDDLITSLNIQPKTSIWDPFLGAGTLALACKQNGISAYGSDLLPLSLVVTKAKIQDYQSKCLRDLFLGFDYTVPAETKDRFADIPIVEKAIPIEVRIFLSHLLLQIESFDQAVQPFFLTALLSILEKASKSIKSGGWLRIDSSKEVSVDHAQSLFINKVEQMILEVEQQIPSKFPERRASFCLWGGDARVTQPDRKVDAIITSPPYLNRHDYTRVFALELALIGVTNSQGLKDLRYQTLRSHVEAKSQMSETSITDMGYEKPELIGQAIEQMETNGLADPRVPRMIEGYFEDMFLVLKNSYEALVNTGVAAFVLGDVRFSGVMLPVTELICEIGSQVGFTTSKVYIARYRGNSAQQMGNFGRVKSKESVIILRKNSV